MGKMIKIMETQGSLTKVTEKQKELEGCIILKSLYRHRNDWYRLKKTEIVRSGLTSWQLYFIGELVG